MWKVLRIILGNTDSLLDNVVNAADVTLGFSKLNYKRERFKQNKELIERAWEGLEEGTISEFEIGDVRIVSVEIIKDLDDE